MLTPDAIRRAVLARLDFMHGECGGGILLHGDGVLRGLIWALTENDPGTYITADIGRLLTLAGIPWHNNGKGITHATPGDPDRPT